MIRSRIAGCGSYLPERIVTNHELTQKIETTDEWIVQRTGIRQRHIAAEGELISDLATHAAKKALEHARIEASALDAIIVATTTPDLTFPATATRVQANLGMTKGFAFDVQAVCSGFVYALTLADNFIRLNQAKNVMVIGAETFSRIIDWSDRTTSVLFGDGAGAIILQQSEGHGDKGDRGILSTHLHADGHHFNTLCTSGGPSSNRQVGTIQMQGQEVFKHAVRRLAEVVDEALAANHVAPHELDWLAPHQANKRIIDSLAEKLSMPPEKVIVTIDQHGNTSAASIPLALCQGVKDGRIQPGQLILIDAMGGGFTWGSALIRW